jgi:uncharacterized protein (TIGR02147 family)
MTRRETPTLPEIAREIPVTEYTGHREYLDALYRSAKKNRKNYSYLRFAEELGFSATNVIRLVIAGERPLTVKAAQRIAKALEFRGDALRYWSTLVALAGAPLPAERDRLFRLLVRSKTKAEPKVLSPAEAEYFSEWFHPVIREMAGLPDFTGEPEWVRDRLAFPLRLDAIRRSLDLLVRLGMLRCDPESGRYARDGVVDSGAQVDSLALVSYHQAMIAVGSESITRIDEDAREIRAITVCLPEGAIEVLKAKIADWTAEVLALENASGLPGSHEVVQVNIQVFPFTRKGGTR